MRKPYFSDISREAFKEIELSILEQSLKNVVDETRIGNGRKEQLDRR